MDPDTEPLDAPSVDRPSLGDLPSLDDTADHLYEGHPDAFVAARDDAVAQARAGGDRDLARAIGRLRRPTRAAWLANLLARRRGEQLDGLLALAGDLVEAQRTLDGAALRALSAQRRRLVAAMAREGARLAAQAGDAATDPVLRDLEGILDAALADAAIAVEVRSGRLTRTVSYSGFGLASGGAPPPRAAARGPHATDHGGPGPASAPRGAAGQASGERVADERAPDGRFVDGRIVDGGAGPGAGPGAGERTQQEQAQQERAQQERAEQERAEQERAERRQQERAGRERAAAEAEQAAVTARDRAQDAEAARADAEAAHRDAKARVADLVTELAAAREHERSAATATREATSTAKAAARAADAAAAGAERARARLADPDGTG